LLLGILVAAKFACQFVGALSQCTVLLFHVIAVGRFGRSVGRWYGIGRRSVAAGDPHMSAFAAASL
jgi:hypothetical protein